MPKYTEDKIFGRYLYFTSHCVLEAMHVHAGDENMAENTAAKFFVREDGSSEMTRRGDLNDREIHGIQAYIKKNYLAMYAKWTRRSRFGFFKG